MINPPFREPAPGALELVQEFLNTNDIEDDRERFASPGALRDWLAERELLEPGIQVTAQDLARTIELREALRALTAAHNHLSADVESATATANQWSARAQLVPRLTADGASLLEPQQSGVDGALGRILAGVHAAIADGTWPRLKACERDSCRWAFYDHSKNQSGRWCQSSTCGTRERSRRAYQRRRRAQGQREPSSE
jgi:predicted RNA-binding Zn ribbon-like protein